MSNETATDRHREMLGALQALQMPPSGRSSASDLSIDEVLLLHSAGWEAVALVYGQSAFSLPRAAWMWQQGAGPVVEATQAATYAVENAVRDVLHDCAAAGGHGVIGAGVEVEVEHARAMARLVGTAVRPIGAQPMVGRPFLSNLAGRDFVLLAGAGWMPVGLAFGTTLIRAPRRSVRATVAQMSQNVELTNLTETLYSAREGAMAAMQSSAKANGATGVVDVRVEEGPMRFAAHVLRFAAWGTGVRLVGDRHRHQRPKIVLPLDDREVLFKASTLGRPEGNA